MLDDAYDVEFVMINPPCDRTYALESELAIATQTIAELVARNMDLHTQIEILRIELQHEREHVAAAPKRKASKPRGVERIKPRHSTHRQTTAKRTAG
jgi:hypothetical protein